jgi:hypothetical protein
MNAARIPKFQLLVGPRCRRWSTLRAPIDFDLSLSGICLGRWHEPSPVRGPHPVHDLGDHRGRESRAGDDHGELPPGHSTTRDDRVGQGVGGIFTSRKRGGDPPEPSTLIANATGAETASPSNVEAKTTRTRTT